jgi:transglutaminase-like putative cysteine protease
VNEKEWFKSEASTWTTNGKATQARDPKYGAEMLQVEWANGEKAPVVEVTSKVFSRDHAVDLTKPGNAAGDNSAAERKFNTAGNELIPVDSIVKQTSDKIVAGKKTEIEKVHAIYEWVVENTFRDAKVRGCGIGDIAAMLKTGNLGGKCADLNALFVGLVRSASIPARDVYGIRVAPSKFGYKALGANSDTITKAQHCRAEVFLKGYGWWRPIRPTCAKSCLRSRRPIWQLTTRKWWPRARRCSAPGRAIGWPITSRTTWRCRARRGPSSAS